MIHRLLTKVLGIGYLAVVALVIFLPTAHGRLIEFRPEATVADALPHIGVLVAVVAFAVVHAVVLVHRDDLQALISGVLFAKVVTLPVFVCGFAVFGLFSGFSTLLAFTWSLRVVPVVMSLLYLAVLPTSLYGIGCVIVLFRRRAVGPRFAAATIILHAVLVADLFSAVVVEWRAQSAARAARSASAGVQQPAADVRPGPPVWSALILVLMVAVFALGAVGDLAILEDNPTSHPTGVVLRFLADHWIALWVGWMLSFTTMAGYVLMHALWLGLRGRSGTLCVAGVIIKIAAVPFFVISFVVLIIVGTVSLVFGLLGLVVAPLLVFGSWLIVLVTSAYGVSTLVVLRRRGQVGWVFTVVHVVLHLLFVADLISMVVVTVVAARRNAAARPRPAARPFVPPASRWSI